MINDVDEVLQQLLIREIPIKNDEVDVEFHQPKREWSARVNRPTLNVFLYDLHENNMLRQNEWEITRNGNGTATKRRTAARIDLHYMITAWATEPDDEHRLLTRTLMALIRTPELPSDLLPQSLQNQPFPIMVRTAEQDALRNAADIWGVLDNEIRPAIACTITLALNPYAPITGPLVRTRELRVGQAAESDQPGKPLIEKFAEGVAPDRFWTVGGTFRSSETPVKDLTLTLVERGLTVNVKPDDGDDASLSGKFVIGNLGTGDYTLEIAAAGRKPRRRKLTVPSPDYDIKA